MCEKPLEVGLTKLQYLNATVCIYIDTAYKMSSSSLGSLSHLIVKTQSTLVLSVGLTKIVITNCFSPMFPKLYLSVERQIAAELV